jgi:MFS family permease
MVLKLPKESAALFATLADYFGERQSPCRPTNAFAAPRACLERSPQPHRRNRWRRFTARPPPPPNPLPGLAVITPTLPYYLAEIGAPSVALWTGVIISSQLAAVVVGNSVWGRFSDKYGPHRAIQATMAGNAIFFGLSAAAFQPWSLVVIRFVAGLFSPLVPSLAYLFAVLTPAETTAGVGRYSLALLCAYVVGAAVVGASYDEVGWLGTSLITAGVAFLALAYISLRPVPASVAVGKVGVSTGVGAALRSPEFVAHGATAFTMGYAMNTMLAVMVVELSEHFRFTVRQTSYVFFAIPAVIAVCALFVVPTAVKRLGHERTIGVGIVIMLPTCALLTTPLARASVYSSIVLFQISIIALSFQQNPNQVISRLIGDTHKYTVNGTGAVVGAGRTCWAAGQAVGPVISLALYSALGHWATGLRGRCWARCSWPTCCCTS